MKGLIISELNQIYNPKGDILHALKKSDSSFNNFGEAYFSFVKYNQIKGWKKHTKMNMNLIVPVGEIKFVFYDDRDKKSEPKINEVTIGQSNYKRLTIPPNIYVSFKGISKNTNLILNIADMEHDPNESINIDLSDISYEWKTTDL